MDAINACSHYGFEKLTLANFFYDGLTFKYEEIARVYVQWSFPP